MRSPLCRDGYPATTALTLGTSSSTDLAMHGARTVAWSGSRPHGTSTSSDHYCRYNSSVHLYVRCPLSG